MFYILPGNEHLIARICMTVSIMGANVIFLVVGIYSFATEFIKDFKHKKIARMSQIMPVGEAEGGNDEDASVRMWSADEKKVPTDLNGEELK